MTFDEFKASLDADAPPAGLSPALTALWHDAKGDWEQAHRVAQDVHDRSGSWVHAYLHRKEGDFSNAGYWYLRAGKPDARDGLEQEWERIVTALLS